jgi:autoinducer 2-degrading protein
VVRRAVITEFLFDCKTDLQLSAACIAPLSQLEFFQQKEDVMFIVHVFIQVKPECVENFKTATLANVRDSIEEPGIARFDFLEEPDSPCFVLVEVYRTPEDATKHKETTHYLVWRDAVAHMMAEPRASTKFSNIAPDDDGWDAANKGICS